MTRRVQNKRSSVAGNVPSASDVEIGGFALNFTDRLVYTKTGAGAIIRLNSRTTVSETAPTDPGAGDEYFKPSTQQRFIYADVGAGLGWVELSPAEDLTLYLPKAGGTMTGHVTLPGGGGVNDAITEGEAQSLVNTTVASYLAKAGGTMTGQITLPGGGTGNQAVTKSELDAAIAGVAAPDLSNYLLKTGGVMSGQITLPGGGTGNQAVSANELAAAISAHNASPDPHTGYTLSTEFNAHVGTGGAAHALATTSVAGFMSAADKVLVSALAFADQAEAEAGTNTTDYMNPLRTAQAIAALANPTPNVQTFLASGTWTKPTGGYKFARVQLWGAGGSGANVNSGGNDAGGGGGGGAYREVWFAIGDLTSTVSVTIGAGGAAKAAGTQAAGANGGDSSFGAYMTAYGGAGGGVQSIGTTGSVTGGGGGGWAAKGVAASGSGSAVTAEQASFSIPGSRSSLVDQLDRHNTSWGGGAGGASAVSGGNLFLCQSGGDALYGGAGGGAACDDNGEAAGGTSIYGGNGGAGKFSAAGVAGSVPGGGGGAAYNSGFASGAGADGKCVVTCY